MKRMVALCITLALVCLLGSTALAAKQELLTVTGDTTCTPGSTITLTFGLAANSNAQAVNVEVTYDTDTFEYVNYENGDLITDALAAGNGTEGKVLFTLATLTPITKAGSLFTATFKVDSKATGTHNFFFYSTSFNVDDGSSAGKDLEVNTVEYGVTVQGESTSSVAVTPVYSTTSEGTQSVVSAHNGEGEVGVVVNSNQTPATSSQPQGKGEGTSSNWVVIGVVVLALGALALLVVAAVAKAKNGDKELEANQSILTEDAKALLDLDKDALENKEDKE